MRYSVWNGQQYDFYEAPGSLRDGVFAPSPKIRARRSLGVAPEEAATALPRGAKLVGRGSFPQGTIATCNGGESPLGMLDFDSPTVRLVTAGAAIYAIYRAFR